MTKGETFIYLSKYDFAFKTVEQSYSNSVWKIYRDKIYIYNLSSCKILFILWSSSVKGKSLLPYKEL